MSCQTRHVHLVLSAVVTGRYPPMPFAYSIVSVADELLSPLFTDGEPLDGCWLELHPELPKEPGLWVITGLLEMHFDERNPNERIEGPSPSWDREPVGVPSAGMLAWRRLERTALFDIAEGRKLDSRRIRVREGFLTRVCHPEQFAETSDPRPRPEYGS